MSARIRIDKWLWAARFFKTRSLAVEAIERRQILVEGQAVKPSREVRVGDTLQVQQGSAIRTVLVLGLSEQRGPAPVAQALYAETEESRIRREAVAEQRRLSPEPANTIQGGRPTKRDRRALQKDHGGGSGWDDRWSASID